MRSYNIYWRKADLVYRNAENREKRKLGRVTRAGSAPAGRRISNITPDPMVRDRTRIFEAVLALLTSVCLGQYEAIAQPSAVVVGPGEVIADTRGKTQATFQLEGGRCRAILEISGLGGFKVLTVVRTSDGRRWESINDVTALAWATKEVLVFTVGYIYSTKPGLFVFSCATGKLTRVTLPQPVNKADHFELQSVSAAGGGMIRFAADSVLYEVRLDGSGFRKVQ